MNSRGKRMVQEDELTYLQELKEAHSDPSAEWGGGGSSYTAGTGITIDDGVLSVNAKAGSGIVLDTDLTDDSLVIMIDQADIPYKSDLATVATTGSYSDLSGKPTIMPTIELTYGTPATPSQIATFEVGATMIFDMYGTKSVYYCKESDDSWWYFYKLDPELTTLNDNGTPASELRIPTVLVYKANGTINTSFITVGDIYFNPETMKLASGNRVSTVIGGGIDSQFPLVTSDFSIVDTTAYCNNNKINYYFAYAAIEAYNLPDTGFYVKVGGLYDTTWKVINFTTSTSGTDVIFTVSNTDVKNSGTWFTYNTTSKTITATSSVFDEYTDTFYNNYVVSNDKYVKELYSVAAKEAGFVSTVDAAFIPIDGTTITVNSDGKLAATGGSGSSYTFTDGLTETSGTVSWDLNDNIHLTSNNNLVLSSPQGLIFRGSVPEASLYITGQRVFDYETGDNVSYRNLVQGRRSFVFGLNNECYSQNTFEFGDGLSNFGTQSNFYYKAYLGNYNDTSNIADKILVIGNGTDGNNRSNAMTVSTDGIIVSKNLPAVSGTDGTYQLTATTSSGTTTYSWAAGGSGSGKYMHKVQIRCNASNTSLVFDDFIVTSSATAYTSAEDYLTDQGYIITDTSSTLTNYLTCMQSGTISTIAVMSGVAYRNGLSVDTSGDMAQTSTWSLVGNTIGITDTVIAL